MANEFIIKNGFHSKGNSQVTGSLNISGSMSGSSMRLTNNLRVVNTGSFGYIKGTTISGSYIGYGGDLTGILPGFWTGSDSFISREGNVEITGSLSVTSTIYATASQALSASYVNIDSLPLVNPKVEYVDCAAITSSGTDITLPNGLLFVSSSTYEYLEIFINGLRQRYDMDFIPTSTASVEYQVTIPLGSEVTYKSLKRP